MPLDATPETLTQTTALEFTQQDAAKIHMMFVEAFRKREFANAEALINAEIERYLKKDGLTRPQQLAMVTLLAKHMRSRESAVKVMAGLALFRNQIPQFVHTCAHAVWGGWAPSPEKLLDILLGDVAPKAAKINFTILNLIPSAFTTTAANTDIAITHRPGTFRRFISWLSGLLQYFASFFTRKRLSADLPVLSPPLELAASSQPSTAESSENDSAPTTPRVAPADRILFEDEGFVVLNDDQGRAPSVPPPPAVTTAKSSSSLSNASAAGRKTSFPSLANFKQSAYFPKTRQRMADAWQSAKVMLTPRKPKI